MAYFDSPLAYVYMIMFLLLSGAFVAGNLFLVNTASLQTFFDIAPTLLVFFAPAVTMRLLAEERRVGTFEILQTKPIKTGEIVVGKFLAAWVIICCALLPTVLYVFIITGFGSVDSGPLIGGYFGLVLLGGVFVAVGLFGSSLRDNQILALIIGVVIGFVLLAVDKILLYVPTPLVGTVEYLGVGHHFSSLARGVIDSRNLIYYGSLIVFFLLLATVSAFQEPGQSLLRWKDFRVGTQLTRVALVAGILLFVNLISMRTFTRLDITGNKMYTLSDVTKSHLRALDDNFLVRAYFSPDLPPPYHRHRQTLQQLLDEYRAYSGGRFHYQFINPASNPASEQEALNEGVTPLQVRVIQNNRLQNIKAYAGLAFSYADKQEHLPVVASLERLEYEITGSLKKMTTRNLKTVAVVTGVGGPDRLHMTSFASAVSRQHRLTAIEFGVPSQIPQAIDALLLIAPTRKLGEREKFYLDQYLMSGGRLGFFINTAQVDIPSMKVQPLPLNLDDLFDAYGWILHKDLVADARCAPFTQGDPLLGDVLYPFFPIAADFGSENPVVKSRLSAAFPYVSSIDPRLAGIRGVTAYTVAASSDQSRRFPLDSAQLKPGQHLAPSVYTERGIPLAIAVEGAFRSAYADIRDPAVRESIGAPLGSSRIIPRSPRTRVVVVGDGDFVLDTMSDRAENVAFSTSLVDWLLGDTSLASIRAKDVTPPPLEEIPEDQKTVVKYMSFAGPPIAVIMIGILWMFGKAARRRKHQQTYS